MASENLQSAFAAQLAKMAPNRQYVIGTAGHIDHGKTALVKALTGIDTDRLPEEKARGITIDLGFAHLSDHITIIDVPGHERLIKNMVAGVSTIDLVLFVIAADDGVMPQSREHLDIINLLQIQQGIFVITKTDLADDDWLLLVEEDIRALTAETPLKNAPILKTSATKGEGISALQAMLLEKLSALPARQDFEVYRQPVDRVFSAKGFGTVITGTVLGGKLSVGDDVEIQPIGGNARVRGLQSHDADVETVQPGFRAAVNLAGIDMDDIQRGMVLTKPGLYPAVEKINARLTMLSASPIPLKNNQRIRLHLHTSEVFARVLIPHAPQIAPGESALVQLKLEQPVHAAFQDRFIIRQYSPQRTIGGGVVLQVNPPRFRKKFQEHFYAMLNLLESDVHEERISGTFDTREGNPLKLWDIKIATNLPLNELQKLLKGMQADQQLYTDNLGGKSVFFSEAQLAEIARRIGPVLEKFHAAFPGRPGMSDGEIASQLEKFFRPESVRKALQYSVKKKLLAMEGAAFRLASFMPQLSAKDSEAYQELERWYREAQYAPPTMKEAMAKSGLSPKEFKELTKLMRDEGKLIYVDEALLFHSSIIAKIKSDLKAFFEKRPEISVPEFKEITQTTRKHSIPLLMYLDSNGITERAEDVRKPGPNL